jgi:hypothetical protein
LRELPKKIAKARLQVSLGEVPDVVSGPHCRYCPAAPACPAKTALVRHLGANLVSVRDKLTALEPADAGKAYAWLNEAIETAQQMREHLREIARIRPIPLPDGSELREVNEKAPTKILGDVAERVLQERFGDEIAKAAIEVEKRTSFTAIKDALRPTAKPGTLAKLERETRDAIRSAGGLKEAVIPKIKIVKGESR